MRRIPVLPIVIVLVTAVGGFAQERTATPPSVSCLGPEGESYLRDLLARIHEIEQERDEAKQALLTEHAEARRLHDKESEVSDRAAALSEREQSRAADLEAAKQEIERLRAASARGADAEKQLAALRSAIDEANEARRKAEEETTAAKQEIERLRAASARGADAEKQLAALRSAIDEANEARRKAEEEITAAKHAAGREAQAREETEKRFAELERQERTATRRDADAPSVSREANPPVAENPPSSGAAKQSVRDRVENTPAPEPSERDLAAAQLAALSGKPKSNAPKEAKPQAAAAPHGERILPGERLTLRVAQIDELNRTVEVDDHGSIDLPLVGMVPAAGRTEAELVADLRERLNAYLKEPRVEVSRARAEKPIAPSDGAEQGSKTVAEEPVRAPHGSYSVEGWVAHPGTYEWTARTTLTSAIAEAGGASFTAHLDEVEIEHPSGGTDARHEIVNVSKLVASGGTDVPIRAGDVVRVPGSSLLALPWGIVRILTFPFWYPFS